MPDVSAKPVIFISFSHKDEPEKPDPDEVAWLSFVQSFLAPVVKTGIFDIWIDEHLHGGDVIDAVIMNKLADCDIFVLLVSRHSLASTYVVEKEIATIRQRQRDGQDVRIFPIVLSPISNAALNPLKDLLLSPKDGKPLSSMSRNDRELAMANIADDIAMVAQGVAQRKAAQPRAAQRVELANIGSLLVETTHLPETPYERLVGREDYLKCLDDAWSGRKSNVVSLIAEGGAGKSSLINEWLTRLRADDYRGAEIVLGWSFYSQGTKERATSGEKFLDWALDQLCIRIETTSAAAKGEAIAEALKRGRILLLLDGCEPLQHGLDSQQGELKDQGLRALLRRFVSESATHKQGLVVLTSRLPVKDIARWKGSAAPVIDVERLSDEAGAELLRDNGVWGTDRELRSAVRDFGGHPLALDLLASFLKETQVGDVRRRDHIRVWTDDGDNPRYGHAKRVMESYEKDWLAETKSSRAPWFLWWMHSRRIPSEKSIMRSIMYIMGLFDRPASSDCLTALRRKPAIVGLTEDISNLDDDGWRRAVARLRGVRLLAPAGLAASEDLDTHPLVREWFGSRLREANEAAWISAHGRLYEHLCDTTKEEDNPTLEQLGPLFQAVAHGCRAGRHEEALRVYQERICRRRSDGTLGSHAFEQLGATGSELAALSHFFEKPYKTVVSTFAAGDRAWVLDMVGFRLRNQGRFAEALPAMDLSLNLAEEAKQFKFAATCAGNLGGAQLFVGDIAASVIAAKKARLFADLSGFGRAMVGMRAYLAEALYAGGKIREAEEGLHAAEQLQESLQPDFPLLYSAQGYIYCDLLLSQRNYAAALVRATRILEWEYELDPLVDRALVRLSLGRANLGMSLANPRSRDVAPTGAHSGRLRLDEAVEGFRAAASIEYLVRGLLGRAAFRRSVGDWEGAERDLDEVKEMAELGPMKLFLCDMALERTRLGFARIEGFAPLNDLFDEFPTKPAVPGAAEAARLTEEGAGDLAIAADYIKTCGYHRRDEELAELQAVLRGERKFADLPPRV